MVLQKCSLSREFGLILMLCITLLCGCGGNGWNPELANEGVGSSATGQLRLKINFVATFPSSNAPRAAIDARAAGVVLIRVHLTPFSGGEMTREFDYTDGGRATINTVPAGPCLVLIQARDQTGGVLFEGSTSVDIQPNLTSSIDSLTLLKPVAGTDPLQPPVIGNITVNEISENSARVNFVTNLPATSSVTLISNKIPVGVFRPALPLVFTNNHFIELKNLVSNRDYTLIVEVSSEAGLKSTANPITFKTQSSLKMEDPNSPLRVVVAASSTTVYPGGIATISANIIGSYTNFSINWETTAGLLSHQSGTTTTRLRAPESLGNVVVTATVNTELRTAAGIIAIAVVEKKIEGITFSGVVSFPGMILSSIKSNPPESGIRGSFVQDFSQFKVYVNGAGGATIQNDGSFTAQGILEAGEYRLEVRNTANITHMISIYGGGRGTTNINPFTTGVAVFLDNLRTALPSSDLSAINTNTELFTTLLNLINGYLSTPGGLSSLAAGGSIGQLGDIITVANANTTLILNPEIIDQPPLTPNVSAYWYDVAIKSIINETTFTIGGDLSLWVDGENMGADMFGSGSFTVYEMVEGSPVARTITSFSQDGDTYYLQWESPTTTYGITIPILIEFFFNDEVNTYYGTLETSYNNPAP